MKKWLFVVLILVLTVSLKAQTVEEFTQQKKTQIKYLVEQIAALKVYAGYVEKGYNIAQKGLSVIHDIKKGDFDLHAGYFTSLVKVNPKIRAYAKGADIVQLQYRMMKLYQSCIAGMKSCGWFSSDEISYGEQVLIHLLNDYTDLLRQLKLITSDDQLQMKDDERLRRIDQLHTEVMDQYSFAQHFNSQIQLLALQRAKEHSSLKTIQSLYVIIQ
ncbi:MAG TPA: hypothetical protein VNS32_19345 [Flavisolibacter sp.]|nr:hypothetical protein [Flavisolibacter sp.]